MSASPGVTDPSGTPDVPSTYTRLSPMNYIEEEDPDVWAAIAAEIFVAIVNAGIDQRGDGALAGDRVGQPNTSLGLVDLYIEGAFVE